MAEGLPVYDGSTWGRFRDTLAHRIANFALRWIATPWYRGMVDGSIRYGLASAARDSRAERGNRSKGSL